MHGCGVASAVMSGRNTGCGVTSVAMTRRYTGCGVASVAKTSHNTDCGVESVAKTGRNTGCGVCRVSCVFFFYYFEYRNSFQLEFLSRSFGEDDTNCRSVFGYWFGVVCSFFRRAALLLVEGGGVSNPTPPADVDDWSKLLVRFIPHSLLADDSSN